jgi:hypothetical protein
MPESIEHSYESEDTQPDQFITAEDRLDAVFESDEANEELTVEYRNNVDAPSVTIPDPDGEIRDSSVRVSRRETTDGSFTYTARDGQDRRPASQEQIDYLENALELAGHTGSEETFDVFTGNDLIKVGNYQIVTPSVPTVGRYPVIRNLDNYEAIGFDRSYGTQRELVEERRGPIRRRNDREENAGIEAVEEANFQWRNLVTSSADERMSSRQYDSLMNSVQSYGIDRAENGEDATGLGQASRSVFNSDFFSNDVPHGATRVSNSNESDEYFRVIRAAGLEDYLPEGVELD